MKKNKEELTAAALNYIRSQDLGESFDESFFVVDEEQEEALRALGVPVLEDRLPIGQDYVYAGCLTFQLSPIGPVLVQL